MENFDFENLNVYKKSLEFIHNILEIYKKLSREFQYSISLDSTRECISVFNVLYRESFIDEGIYSKLRLEAREITSMLCGLIDSIG
ncbi:MAG: four helix bundle protein [Candidatus Omnitrophota bacterium]